MPHGCSRRQVLGADKLIDGKCAFALQRVTALLVLALDTAMSIRASSSTTTLVSFGVTPSTSLCLKHGGAVAPCARR